MRKGKNMPQPNNQQKGRAGEAYVVAELNRRGIYATSFAGSMPIIDIVATNQEQTKSVNIQVKTKTTRQGWQIGKGIERHVHGDNFFVILVDLCREGTPDFYIFERLELKRRVEEIYRQYLTRPRMDGGQRRETDIRWIDVRNFTASDKARLNHWELLGLS